MAFTTVTVTGRVEYEDGTPCAGTVKFQLPYQINNGVSNRSAEYSFTLSTGDIPGASTVYALNDPGTYPNANRGYKVVVTVGSYVYETYVYARAGEDVRLGTIKVPTPTGKSFANNIVFKAGALTTTELPYKGMVGIDTTNHRIYVNETGSAVKYAALT